MNVLAVNGSLRGARGTSAVILDRLGDGVRKAGGQFQTIHLADMRIEACGVCQRCQRNRDGVCAHDGHDDVQSVFAAIRSADVVVYATPIYVFGLSSLLKRLVERLYALAPVSDLTVTGCGLFFHATDASVAARPFVTLLVCDNMEDETVRSTAAYFRSWARFLDAPHVGHLERRSAALWRHELERGDGAAGARAARILDSFGLAGAELVRRGRIGRATARRCAEPVVAIPPIAFLLRRLPPCRPRLQQVLEARAGRTTDME